MAIQFTFVTDNHQIRLDDGKWIVRQPYIERCGEELCISPLFVLYKREADWIIPWKVPDDPEKDQPYKKSVRQILLPGHSLEVFHTLL